MMFVLCHFVEVLDISIKKNKKRAFHVKDFPFSMSVAAFRVRFHFPFLAFPYAQVNPVFRAGVKRVKEENMLTPYNDNILINSQTSKQRTL